MNPIPSPDRCARLGCGQPALSNVHEMFDGVRPRGYPRHAFVPPVLPPVLATPETTPQHEPRCSVCGGDQHQLCHNTNVNFRSIATHEFKSVAAPAREPAPPQCGNVFEVFPENPRVLCTRLAGHRGEHRNTPSDGIRPFHWCKHGYRVGSQAGQCMHCSDIGAARREAPRNTAMLRAERAQLLDRLGALEVEIREASEAEMLAAWDLNATLRHGGRAYTLLEGLLHVTEDAPCCCIPCIAIRDAIEALRGGEAPRPSTPGSPAKHPDCVAAFCCGGKNGLPCYVEGNIAESDALHDSECAHGKGPGCDECGGGEPDSGTRRSTVSELIDAAVTAEQAVTRGEVSPSAPLASIHDSCGVCGGPPTARVHFGEPSGMIAAQ